MRLVDMVKYRNIIGKTNKDKYVSVYQDVGGHSLTNRFDLLVLNSHLTHNFESKSNQR